MFGNTLGWVISLAIAACVAMLVQAYGVPARISAPTGARELAPGLKPAALPTDPAAVIPTGTDDCDAGELYRQAAASVKQKARKYEAYDKATGPEAKRKAAAAIEEDIDLLVRATRCARMTLFADKPGRVVNYDNVKPLLPELEQLGGMAVAVGALYYRTDPPKARSYMEASFVLGRHLYEERVVFEEYRLGLALMSNAAGILAKFGTDASDTARAEQLGRFQVEVDGQLQKILPVWQAISGIPAENRPLQYPGDIFLFALTSEEPMWRTEALLKLGRMRYMRGVTYGDQTGANRILKQTAQRNDVPPNVRAAAEAGRDLTVEKFRMYGGGS